MALAWYRQDKEAAAAALRRGERPDMATTMSSGPLDGLVALHDELGVFAALDAVEPARERAGIADRLLLRTLATLPFVAAASLSGATGLLFKEPAILLHLGRAAVQIREGSNARHRHPLGRQEESLPCHPDTLRDALRRVAAAAWQRVQEAGVAALYAHRLVGGHVYAIDGSGLGEGLRVVALVAVSGARPLLVAWRLLSGHASEKGQEARVTRELVEQARRLGGPRCIRLLLADALYADGPLLAWLKYRCDIDVLVPLPTDRDLYADLAGLVATGRVPWTTHHYRVVQQGHKRLRTVRCAAVDELTSWASFLEAAAGVGAQAPHLWATLIRVQPAPGQAAEEPRALVSTRPWRDGFAALQAFRPRWHIENDAYRELKQGWGLEAQRWGRDLPALLGRLTLTCLACNTAQVYRSRAGEQVAALAIRRLRRHYQPHLGASPAVIFLGDCYAVLPLEELLDVLGARARESLLPAPRPKAPG
jgi:DDE family transposase